MSAASPLHAATLHADPPSRRLSHDAGLRARLHLVLALTFVLLPVALLYAALLHAERPVPMSDDFLAILNFSLQWSALPHGFPRVLEVIASQHNEYKLIVEHTIVAADLALTGHLHFGLFIWTGNLMLLGVGSLFWRNFFAELDPALRLFLFAPAAWLLFQLNYVENFDWAMCGLQTLPVLLFTLAGLHFLLQSHRGSFGLACGSAMLGCLSSGNGFLMAPLGLVILLSARRPRAAVLWTGSYLFALVLYLYRYHRFLHPEYTQQNLLHKVVFFLSFLGAAAENMHHLPFRNASTGLGVLIICVLAVAWQRGFYRERPFLFWTAVWCMLTAAVATQARIGEGMVVALTLRYKVYSDLLSIFCYGLGVSTVRASRLPAIQQRSLYAATAIVVVMLVSISDAIGYRFLMQREHNTQIALAAFLTNEASASPEIGANGIPVSDLRSALDRRILLECIAQGIYKLPPAPDL